MVQHVRVKSQPRTEHTRGTELTGTEAREHSAGAQELTWAYSHDGRSDALTLRSPRGLLAAQTILAGGRQTATT